MEKCDICKEEAVYDGKTKIGPWAYMCESCFIKHGINIKGLFTKLAKGGSKNEKSR